MTEQERYEEIRAKLGKGTAVVYTADEFKKLAETLPPEELARRVDVVTVATYAPMCSSGVFINFGHGNPPIRMETLTLNGVPAYGGVAAVDAYLGATAELEGDPSYGGGHVIEALVKGEPVELKAQGKGTDCYPGREVHRSITKDDLNEFYFYNPRNVYQNYGAAATSGPERLSTYLGVLDPELATVSYATAGELSPLLNDPECRTIGTGTPAFVAGAVGYVAGPGTQFNPEAAADENGVPTGGARTLALKADAKAADPHYVSAARIEGYGTSLFVGVGFALPVLDAAMAKRLSIRDKDITVLVRDYGKPDRPVLAKTDYQELRSGSLDLGGRRAKTSCSSSLAKARELCDLLKEKVLKGEFPLREPFERFPTEGKPKPLGGKQLEVKESAPGREQANSGTAAVGPAGYRRELCVDCGSCAAHCPAQALSIGAPEWRLRYDLAACIACGACGRACPRDAFALKAPSTRRER